MFDCDFCFVFICVIFVLSLYGNCNSFYVVSNICILEVLSSSNSCNPIIFLGSSNNKRTNMPNSRISVISTKNLSQPDISSLLLLGSKFCLNGSGLYFVKY